MISNLSSTQKMSNESSNESTKICVPNYDGKWYPDLDSAVRALQAVTKSLNYELRGIVQYNVRYRDYLREHGNEALVELMLSEAPTLKESPEDVKYLRYWLKNDLEEVAAYDIQCYNINDTIELFGKEIHGLNQLLKCTEVFMKDESDPRPWLPKNPRPKIDGLHIGQMYMSYPKFDSYDSGDDREYQNYIIRDHPISENEMKKLYDLPSGSNAIRVHEYIPESMLPVVYYEGTGNYMLVANKK
ncbi:MAG: hypothetical protein IKS94_09345 [Prevotella sp.]|nr:hypothetical protein [Prevotella sp.]